MADLGAIAHSKFNIYRSRPTSFWRDYSTTANLLAYDVSDTVTVIVDVDSVVQAVALVRLYYKPNGKFINSGLTDAAGEITFSNLDVNDTANYFAVITLSTGSHNALIFDKL